MKHIVITFYIASMSPMAVYSDEFCPYAKSGLHICQFLETGLHIGGSTITDTNIPSTRVQSVKAGGLFSLSYGFSANIYDTAEIRGSIGYKSDDSYDFEYDTGFWVYTSEIMIFTKNKRLNFGVGASYYFEPEFNSTFDIEYENANGWLFEVDYNLFAFMHIGIKRSIIRYTEKTPLNGSIDGSSYAIVGGFRF